jgi:hypothetical protein
MVRYQSAGPMVSWPSPDGMERVKSWPKVLPGEAAAAPKIQFFGLYSLSEETNPLRMGTLTPDGQSNVRRFFVRQAACSGSKVPRNTV